MRKTRVFIYIILLSVFMVFTFLNADTVLKTSNVTEPSIDVLSLNAYGMKLKFSISDIELTEIDTKEGRFIALDIPGTHFIREIGKPQLPCYRTFIEVPYGSEPVVNLKDVTIKKANVSYPIIPTQAPIPKIRGAIEAAEFDYNAKFYSINGMYPGKIVNIKEAGIMREHRIFLLEINPVSYNPEKGKLEIRTSIEIEIIFSHPDIENSVQKLEHYRNPQFEKFVKELILNYGALESLINLPPNPIGYLIIVHDGYETSITPFAQWKKQKGYHVTVTKTSEIPGGPTAANIQAYIQDAYNNWTIPPTFVLLVGDVAQIPAFTGSETGSVTDLYYAAISGSDYFPDLWVGRFSADSSANVDVMVEKVVDYEKTDWSSGTGWIKKAVFLASRDNHTISEGTHRYVIQTHLAPAGYVSDSLWNNDGATTQDVRDALNDGRSIAAFSGHGSEGGWGDGPPFSKYDVRNLTNLDMYPMVSSHSCLTGDFGYYSECFGETWVRVPGKGAISFWGASTYSYWTEDDVLERRMFDKLFYNNLTWLAGMQDAALYEVYLAGFTLAKYYHEEYNLLGDPSMMLWTEVPQTLTVTHPPLIPVGPYNIPVNVLVYGAPVDSALVSALVKSTDSLTVAYTVGGNATLSVNTTGWDTVLVTVTGYNLEPYIGVVLVGSGPYISHLKSTIVDSLGGNGNGDANPGETINLPTWTINCGTEVANNVYCLFSTADSFAAVTQDSSFFGTVAAGDSALGTLDYVFMVDPRCSDMHSIVFDLTAYDEAGTTWVSQFEVTVLAMMGVEDDNSLSLPANYNLSNIYPNPVKDRTVISYQIPLRSAVSLCVYDVSGRLVNMLVNGIVEPGYRSLGLDTRTYSSGIYFLRLKAGDKVITKKMMVLK